MTINSKKTLRILAAIVWHLGAVMLATKGGRLLIQAKQIKPEEWWIWFAIILSLLIGGIKARFLFSKVNKKNLSRIDKLREPKVWQFYRPGFFLFLAAMILLGSTLSKLARGNYPFLIGVAMLDLSLATALLISSVSFWKHKPFVPIKPERGGED